MATGEHVRQPPCHAVKRHLAINATERVEIVPLVNNIVFEERVGLDSYGFVVDDFQVLNSLCSKAPVGNLEFRLRCFNYF